MTDTRSLLANDYLKAMGIEIWLERNPAQSIHTPTVENITPLQTIISNTSEATKLNPAPALTSAAEATPLPLKDSPISTLDWQGLRSLVSGCMGCELSTSRSKVVFGSGNPKASLMLISDAPDNDEDVAGEPFVGDTGQLLTAMLKAIGFKRNHVYITNITKCKTPGNREPSVEETEHCWPYLKRQIDLIQPDLILVLGLTAAQRLLNTKSTLNRLRGQLHYVENINSPVVVSYHPAYLLRAPNEKRKAWEDLQMLMQELNMNKE